ncbi:MarR family winged helix-turn-helix transcriptional regulator (plasmid) [Agrobacterium leguminum]|uniref:MarR family winged helix-turn-helix transcriptional regulator n=1 Tax=Agrobacterium leguminum TaxID=2792015 RepID=UPI0030CBB1BA
MKKACYCSLLRTATRKIESVYDRALAPLGVNIAQYSLLRGIKRLQPASLTDLGRDAELDRSTIGRNVRVLERIGLVVTGRGDVDRREAVVRLSDRGNELLGDAAALWEECQQKFEDRIGPAQIKTLQDILKTL